MSLMTSSFTNQCYSFHIKDQGIVQNETHAAATMYVSTEVKALKWIKRIKAIMRKMKQDRRYLKMKTLGCCAFQCSLLALLNLHRYSAAKILRAY